MLEDAMADAPDIVVLPELWDIGFFPRPLEKYVDENGAKAKTLLSLLAKQYHVHIVGGSVAVKIGDYIANRCYVFDRNGDLVADYDKTHLFSPAKHWSAISKNRSWPDGEWPFLNWSYQRRR